MPTFADQRIAYDATRCTFEPRSSRYFDRCRDAATLVRRALPDGPDDRYHRRCDRHAAIDARTAANRGWGGDTLYPFDAPAEHARIIAERERAAETEASRQRHEAAVAALRVVIASAEDIALSADDTATIDRILRGLTRD